MKILKQITIVFLLCWLGEVISALLPFAFPGSIVAMLLLLGCLSTSLLRIEDVSGFAGFLLANMAFLSLIHISEPTRQAEISYAVFCLKKKKTKIKYICQPRTY